MSWQLKKIVPIFFAVIVGAGIIFVAFNSNTLFGGKVSTEHANDITAQNGAWADSLKIIPQSSTEKPLGVSKSTVAMNEVPTTTTGFIAQELLAGYATAQAGKGSASLSNAEAAAIAQSLSDKAHSVSDVKQYSEKDLLMVTTSTSTIEAYKKDMTAAFNAFTEKTPANELAIVAAAVDNKDASKLAPLAVNVANLQKLVNNLLAVHTPSSMVLFHLSLVQGYATMLSGVIDMQQIIADPLRGMRGIAKYNNGLGLIDKAVAMLNIK